jgi:DNA mismatch endonuclease (patch repair protein)
MAASGTCTPAPNARRASVNNAAYWQKKRDGNAARDRRNVRRLRRDGWRVLTVWECQVRDPDKLTRRIAAFLSARSPRPDC